MMVLPMRINYPLDVTVQCPHDADPGEHRGAAILYRLARVGDLYRLAGRAASGLVKWFGDITKFHG
jgi:hypothetical protein